MTNKGTYLLLLHLGTAHPQLQIGRLGWYDFAAGYYLYVGSAFGAGGLPARLAHHRLRVKPRPHWHIDYLRPYAHLCEIWSLASSHRLEEAWCAALMNIAGMQLPVRDFGSSDTGSPAHLFYTPVYPQPGTLSRALLPVSFAAGSAISPIVLNVQQFVD